MSRDVMLNYLFQMGRAGASDLYLTVGSKPLMRVGQELIPVAEDVLTPPIMQTLLRGVLDERQLADYFRNLEYNVALDLGQVGRFRLNVLQQKQFPAMVIRRIITRIPEFEQLNLPDVYAKLAMEKRGLVLVCGMTGSGKSTSLASMVDYRNRREAGHIITIEDPIEYYHDHQKGLVTQREVGVDTHSYQDALKNALRQRPDVILVGEIRDTLVMEQALGCAESGHLCLATVHANNAYQALERVVNFFPEEQAQQVRASLAGNLKGVLSQRLVPSKRGINVPALEILINQGLSRDLILKGEFSKILEVIDKNTMLGMRTFDQSLTALYSQGVIDKDVAIDNADRPSEMQIKLNSVQVMPQSDGAIEKKVEDVFKDTSSSPAPAQMGTQGHHASAQMLQQPASAQPDQSLSFLDPDSMKLHD